MPGSGHHPACPAVPGGLLSLIHTRGTGTVCAVRQYERSVRPSAISVLSGVER